MYQTRPFRFKPLTLASFEGPRSSAERPGHFCDSCTLKIAQWLIVIAKKALDCTSGVAHSYVFTEQPRERSSGKEHTVDALAPGADEGRGKLR